MGKQLQIEPSNWPRNTNYPVMHSISENIRPIQAMMDGSKVKKIKKKYGQNIQHIKEVRTKSDKIADLEYTLFFDEFFFDIRGYG